MKRLTSNQRMGIELALAIMVLIAIYLAVSSRGPEVVMQQPMTVDTVVVEAPAPAQPKAAPKRKEQHKAPKAPERRPREEEF